MNLDRQCVDVVSNVLVMLVDIKVVSLKCSICSSILPSVV
jgi:hypothetical protein